YEVEKKARIELEELDKAKDQFILTTQHHLRTPLTIVKGFIELSLDEKEANQNVKTYLGKADDAVERMSGLINDLLSVSQVEIGKVKPQPVVLREVIEEMRSELSPAIEGKGISFVITFSPEAGNIKIAADRKIIKAALYNLIDNAVKYTSKGGVTVHGEIFKPVEGDIPFLKVDITDTGIGIDQKDLPLIFNRFFERGAEAQKVNLAGKGIGLALSKRIIESHGGMVSVSSPGKEKGSTFTVKFPVIVG
ncbi:MAG: HAMP domain-containing sensor histidine kinase, partial [Patescibacteria group bacterium]|nr:HAMP domain-containing sensor histidine kinase [bacterium]MDZ4240676.1 HAMP domain-containing sensor histidine kinase [Patescibacteria group bacterium]